MRTKKKQLQLRLPPDLKSWIEEQAEANAASQNSEIVRAIRERMQRESIETIRAEANAIQAHADALEAEGMGE
ncbi:MULTISPECIES: Arc family DNA-binding protein [unclassified Sulfitobacter]|uniref:Arc family DNA-binding protein n=1 Tax=unclassified Sulfitobacter TaxID=196795 RepID=UPI000B04A335|nr:MULTISPECIES: Arc family DNA-binding protein [unclassified Sulfitobacter]